MADVSGFSEFIGFMAGADAFSLLLPFLLSWMVFYIALEKADFVFPDDLENMAPLMALIMAFFTARFIVMNPFYQTFFIDFFGKITIGVIGILGLLTMLAFVGYEQSVINKGAFVVFILMSVGAAFVYAGGFGPPIVQEFGVFSMINNGMVWLLETGAIWAVVVGGAIWFVTKEPSSQEEENSTGFTALDWLINADVEDKLKDNK
ncbi:MAG: hypothetical protein ABEJ95_01340 [Candidatus Nanohalobium sp.]